MGKRSNFPRIARDLYPTPRDPVLCLAPHLPAATRYAEPCCGNGDLVGHLTGLGFPLGFACDIDPGVETFAYADIRDALTLDAIDLFDCDMIITNPPWPAPYRFGEPTLSLIRRFSRILPTWLLLPADFAHNAYAGEVLHYCQKIVSVGRVRWISGSENDGKDNSAWYLFDQAGERGRTVFVGRVPVGALDPASQLLIG